MHPIHIPKKLIEVALPLDDINRAAAREKSIRHGHPSTLHLWWARRPLAAARAVIFAQMVNDPGYEAGKGFRRGVNKKAAEIRREQLFDIIRELVQWENSNNPDVLKHANDAIWASWRETCELNKKHPQAATLFNPNVLPAFHDPFAGGGALPLEAQRLGLAAYASDLNPVAVMINKAMLDIPPRFAGIHPIGPLPAGEQQSGMAQDWPGTSGLAETVRRYGHWMRDEAVKRIGHLYPTITITAEMCATRPDLKPLLGQELTVIAWLWARTVRSANPAYSHCQVPLVSSFILSSKAGKEAYVAPEIAGDNYRFTVKMGKPPAAAKNGTKAARGANFTCLLSGSPLNQAHIREEFKQKRVGQRLMAIVAEGKNGRVYLSPTAEMEAIAHSAQPGWQPDIAMNQDCRDLVSGRGYGITQWSELFTARQLTALSTFSDLVQATKDRISADARAAGMTDDGIGLAQGGTGATAFSEAVSFYLGMTISRLSNSINTAAVWSQSREQSVNMFSRQAIPMTWDFPEVNPFAGAAGDYMVSLINLLKAMNKLPAINQSIICLSLNHTSVDYIQQADARTQTISLNKVISTDPPYYDNISYADLSDFFYIWLRHNLRPIFPQLFATIAVPKDAELIASPHRHKNKREAEAFFLHGMTEAMRQMATQAHPAFPVTIYYAFKQAENKDAGIVSTGWETFLQAVIHAGFAIVGTWPLRTERPTGVKVNTNALASSIVLVCQRRRDDAATVSRRDFLRELEQTLPDYLEAMIGGSDGATPIAPVDLAQAAIGPGMAVYSQYAAVRKQDGSDLSVHEALGLINQAISDYLSPEAGDFDAATRFCNAWFEQYGWAQGAFGDADTLSRAKGTGVNAMHGAVIEALAGKVRLLRWQEYPAPADWQPPQGAIPAWQACHQLIRAFQQDGSDAAGALLARIPKQAEHIRQLCYHLYTLCERKKWAEDARAYNELANAWHDITIAAQGHEDRQMEMDLL